MGLSKNWVLANGQTPDALKNPPDTEQRVLVRVPGQPGGEYFWVVYPRGAGESSPVVTQLAPGVMKVVTQESTDYILMSPLPLQWQGEGITFSGTTGAVRLWNDNHLTLALMGGGGSVGYKGRVLTANQASEQTFSLPQSAGTTVAGSAAAVPPPSVTAVGGGFHFVDTAKSYASLAGGHFAVRGMGPFDLTLTDDAITGSVDGDERTLVMTKPAHLDRPRYLMDGQVWYAGFPDDTSPYTDQTAPQLSLAMGVTAGPHKVEVGQWQWPELPPIPARQALP